MRKQINKTEREAVIRALVVDASLKTSKKLCAKFVKLRQEIHKLLLSNWQNEMPKVSRDDQLKMLQSTCAQTLTFIPSVEDEEGNVCAEFARMTWTNVKSDVEKVRRYQMSSLLFDATPELSTVVDDLVTAGWQSVLRINPRFPDIINGFQPSRLKPGSESQHTKELLRCHAQAMMLLQELYALLDSMETMYHEVGAAIAPVKTAAALAALMPESVKFFPPSMTYEPPTKQIADPKAINDIRAKLKAGLPI